MRMTQFIGLTTEAKDFLRENCVQDVSMACPHCNKPIYYKHKSEVYESAAHFGMFDDGPELDKYFLKDGTTVKEVVQACPWSSGPCIFLCLEKEDGTKIFEWSVTEINNA